MKNQFKSLVEFAEQIERYEQMNQDYVAPADKILMTADKNLAIENTGEFVVNDYTHGQIASRLSIPKTYYDNMSEIEGLRSLNVNAWLRHNNDKHFIRTQEGKARAFLSDRYRPLDHFPVLSGAIFPVIQDYKDIKIVSSSLSEKKMYLQFMFQNMKAEVVPGDVIHYGITITNSEVGAGALDVKSFLWRLKCSNGMVAESLIRKYHVGRRMEEQESMDIFANDTLKAEIEAYKLKIRDVINHSISESVFAEKMLKLQDATHDQIEKVSETVENVTRKYSGILYESEKDSLIKNMINDGNINRYGLANSITFMAHQIDNIDRSYELEKLGNQVIDLSPKEWGKIAA